MISGLPSTAMPAPARCRMASGQYSSRTPGIPGYGTSLDCNRVYKDYEQLMIQAGLQGHTAPTPEDTTPNKLDKQRITIGRISSGDRATIRACAMAWD